MNLWIHRLLYWVGAWATGFIIGFCCACGMSKWEGLLFFILSFSLLTLVFVIVWRIEKRNE